MNWSSNAAITLTLLFSGAMMGVELKPDTEHAWQDYLAGADRRMTDRTQGNFLWVDESDDLLRRVRAGEIVVSPIQPAMPIAVPHGLVHHWIGASFLPGAQMNEVIARLRDYDRYGDVYAPTVKEVQVLQRSSHSDQARDDFVLTLVNQSFFSQRAIEDESSSTYVRLDARRWYALSHSVRIQEWAGYGASKPQKLRVGEGSGYVWKSPPSPGSKSAMAACISSWKQLH